MKKGQDIVAQFPGLVIIHQKVPGRELGRHTHAEHEIFIPLQGEISVSWDEKQVTCGPGKMLYVPPQLEHSFSSSAHGEGERIIFLVEHSLWKKSATREFLPTGMPLSSLVRELIFFLLLRPESKYGKTMIAAVVDSLLEQLELHSTLSTEGIEHLEGKIVDGRIKRAYQQIVQKGDIPLEALARESGLSTRNLARLFVAEVGMPPKQLMMALKMERAMKLLKSTSHTITDIGLEVGYQSLSKFIAAFQKYSGVLPSEYRSS